LCQHRLFDKAERKIRVILNDLPNLRPVFDLLRHASAAGVGVNFDIRYKLVI